MKRLKDFAIFESEFGYPAQTSGKYVAGEWVGDDKLPGYQQVADELKRLGHTTRAKKVEDWVKFKLDRKKKEEEEEAARLKAKEASIRKGDISAFRPFQIQFYLPKWNGNMVQYEFLAEGLFYIEPHFPDYWFGDMIYEHEEYQHGLSMPIELGTMPANEESEKIWAEIEKKRNLDVYEGICQTTRLYIPIFDENSFDITTCNQTCSWENLDNVIFVFGSESMNEGQKRKEAKDFKNLLIDGLLGKNLFGKNKWNPLGIHGSIKKFIENDKKWREDERKKGKEIRVQFFTEQHIEVLANRVSSSLKERDLIKH